MIGKCRAIAHGSTALDYIFWEGKFGSRLAFHNLCSRELKTIHEEMKAVSDYNSRCRNKFLYELNKNGIAIECMKNKQGKVYGLKFSYDGMTFKASEIGREFGYHSLQKNFETTNKEEPMKLHQTIQEPTEKSEQPDTGYQLVPKSRSSISRDSDAPQAKNLINEVSDATINAADELVEGIDDLITPSTHGNDYIEAAWQRKLRNQANRKKRRRGM